MSDIILLLRYSNFHGVDTIAEHQKVILQTGHCWWAKLGRQPSSEYLKKIMAQDEKTIFLFTSGSLYKCELGEIKRECPNSDFPDYYIRDIFDSEDVPSVYFELLSIEKTELSVLDNYLICSSGKEVLYDLKKSLSSYMYVQDRNMPLPSKPVKQAKAKKVVLDRRSCIYKKNGFCSNRACVNYLYECLRPLSCLKQKPISVNVS